MVMIVEYKLKRPAGIRRVKRVCLRGDAERYVSVNMALPLPNTPQEAPIGFRLPRAGTWLGCKLGNHRWYFDYEVEHVR